ncbi:MAG: hypothetical protein OXT65_11840 [Alphaproteobacteria bacterium]|nr:hypothetical protein [Alphaproteobacteria bacterium]
MFFRKKQPKPDAITLLRQRIGKVKSMRGDVVEQYKHVEQIQSDVTAAIKKIDENTDQWSLRVTELVGTPSGILLCGAGVLLAAGPAGVAGMIAAGMGGMAVGVGGGAVVGHQAGKIYQRTKRKLRAELTDYSHQMKALKQDILENRIDEIIADRRGHALLESSVDLKTHFIWSALRKEKERSCALPKPGNKPPFFPEAGQ